MMKRKHKPHTERNLSRGEALPPLRGFFLSKAEANESHPIRHSAPKTKATTHPGSCGENVLNLHIYCYRNHDHPGIFRSI